MCNGYWIIYMPSHIQVATMMYDSYLAHATPSAPLNWSLKSRLTDNLGRMCGQTSGNFFVAKCSQTVTTGQIWLQFG